jgi:hypothetical protein
MTSVTGIAAMYFWRVTVSQTAFTHRIHTGDNCGSVTERNTVASSGIQPAERMRFYMRIYTKGLIVGVAALLVALPVRAQAPRASGRWLVTFDANVTRKGAAVVVEAREQATLQLTQRGDSVSGTWKVASAPPRIVHGTYDGKTLALRTETAEQEIRVNGKPVKMQSMTEWSAAISGVTIAGTMLVRLGDRAPVPRKWEGLRN